MKNQNKNELVKDRTIRIIRGKVKRNFIKIDLKIEINERGERIESKRKEHVNSGGESEETNEEAARKLATIRTSLKYLYKLLKYHRLEHYMNELIKNGLYTPMSLSQLNVGTAGSSGGGGGGGGVDLDHLGVASVYDRRRFAQMKQFVRSVVASVQRSRSATATTKRRDTTASNHHPDEMIMKSLLCAKSTAAGRAANPSYLQADILSKERKPQLFKKNPNLTNGARSTTVTKKLSAKQVATQPVRPTTSSVPNKVQLQRAKSSEPLDFRKNPAALNFSIAPSKSTITIGLLPNF